MPRAGLHSMRMHARTTRLQHVLGGRRASLQPHTLHWQDPSVAACVPHCLIGPTTARPTCLLACCPQHTTTFSLPPNSSASLPLHHAAGEKDRANEIMIQAGVLHAARSLHPTIPWRSADCTALAVPLRCCTAPMLYRPWLMWLDIGPLSRAGLSPKQAMTQGSSCQSDRPPSRQTGSFLPVRLTVPSSPRGGPVVAAQGFIIRIRTVHRGPFVFLTGPQRVAPAAGGHAHSWTRL